MSQQIGNIPSIQNHKQIYFKQNQQPTAGNGPSMQGQQVENPVMRMASSTGDDPKDMLYTAALFPPMMIGLYKTMDGFARANGGAYNSSLSGRLANLGDKIAKSTGFLNPVINLTTRAWNGIVRRSPILTAMTKMPSVIENSLAKGQLHGTEEQLGSEFLTFVEKYLKKGGKLEDLGGLTKSKYTTIKKLLSSDSPKNVKKALNSISNICDQVKASKSVKFDNFLGSLTGRTVTLEQIGNQIKSITKPTTKLGRLLPKIGIRGMHGLTFGGGVFMLLSGVSLAQAAVKTSKAEKGEKFKTFMEEFLGNISWVVTLPLGSRIMNAFQGLANIGMTPAKLAKYRQALKVHNATKFLTKAEWLASANNLKSLWAPDKVGFFAKIARGIGRFLNTGREVVKPFMYKNPTSVAQKLHNVFAKSKFFGRNALAYLIGLPVYMLIFAPIADKIFVKISHAIFGKPKHSRYDEEPEQKAEEIPQQVSDAGKTNPTQTVAPVNPQEFKSDTNLIKQASKGNFPHQGTTQTPKTSSGQDAEYEPIRRYIPSPVGMVPQSPDTTALDQALAQADRAEQQIQEVLAGKKYF